MSRAATPSSSAELGVLAFKRGYAAWSEASAGPDEPVGELAPYTIAALDELRVASAGLG